MKETKDNFPPQLLWLCLLLPLFMTSGCLIRSVMPFTSLGEEGIGVSGTNIIVLQSYTKCQGKLPDTAGSGYTTSYEGVGAIWFDCGDAARKPCSTRTVKLADRGARVKLIPGLPIGVISVGQGRDRRDRAMDLASGRLLPEPWVVTNADYVKFGAATKSFHQMYCCRKDGRFRAFDLMTAQELDLKNACLPLSTNCADFVHNAYTDDFRYYYRWSSQGRITRVVVTGAGGSQERVYTNALRIESVNGILHVLSHGQFEPGHWTYEVETWDGSKRYQTQLPWTYVHFQVSWDCLHSQVVFHRGGSLGESAPFLVAIWRYEENKMQTIDLKEALAGSKTAFVKTMKAETRSYDE